MEEKRKEEEEEETHTHTHTHTPSMNSKVHFKFGTDSNQSLAPFTLCKIILKASQCGLKNTDFGTI